MEFRDLTFGVEIECTGKTREETAGILSQFFGSPYYHTGNGYDKYEISDTQGRRWTVMLDSSLLAQRKRRQGVIEAADSRYKVEVVTPVLKYEDMPLLQEVIRALRHGGLFTNESMGQHIHVGISGFTPKQLANLVNTLYTKQDMLYQSLGVYASRQHYCQKLPAHLVEKIKEKKPDTLEDFADIWYEELGDSYTSRDTHYNPSRYHALNLHNYLSGRQPTAELRCANAVTHAGKVRATVEFFMLTVAYAANATRTSIKVTVPHGSVRYTFRCFLLKIGAIGEQFKTLRKHMLERLSGNTAWREIT